MGEWVGLGDRIGFRRIFRLLVILLNVLFNKIGIWN